MQVNAELVVDYVGITEHTLYTNPYMTINDREYTKHYYIEGQRICSSIGGGMMNNPRGLHDELAYLHDSYANMKVVQEHKIRSDANCVGISPDYLNLPPAFEHLGGQAGRDEVEKDRYFYHSDHIGSSSFITDNDGLTSQHLQYLPFGETFIEQQSGAPYNTAYKFSGKEKDEETGYNYHGARYLFLDGSFWLSVDPIADDYPHISAYNYCFNNPINLIDPDGKAAGSPSTHTDETGTVIAVKNDGDLGVYKHKGTGADDMKNYSATNTSAGGTKMGETVNWDEFTNPETGKALTSTTIQFGKSFDPIIKEMHKKAEGMDLKQIAANSAGGGLFDIKKDYKNVGALLNGKYATSRSAGNFLAGYNAEQGSYYGFGISFFTFQRLAGATHVMESKGKRLSDGEKRGIVIFGTSYGSPPTFGEKMYQFRMSEAGWEKSRKEHR